MSYKTREQWLLAAVNKIRPIFKGVNYEIPTALRVSCGLPSTRAFGTRKRAIGEAWCSKSSRDEHFEIFVSPTVDDEKIVLSCLVHELVHVTVGVDKGHRGAFRECARQVGLEGPMTLTTASQGLVTMLKVIADELGPYPHKSLEKMTNGKKKQTTRLIRCSCKDCCYTVRAAMSWILMGTPVCPNEECGRYLQSMEVDLPEESLEELEKGERLPEDSLED